MLLSVICHAQPLTERYTVELERKTSVPNPRFSIKCDRRTLPGSTSDISDTSDYAGSDSPSDKKHNRSGGYGVKTPLIESASWQLFYATFVLVGYERMLTTRNAPLSSPPYSWLPAEVVVAVGWLKTSYPLLDSPLFNTIKQSIVQPETSQDHSFTTITMMLGSGQDQQQDLPFESWESQATADHTGFFTHLTYYDHDHGDGDGGPEQHQHTFGLNCYVHPCYGVCQFRPLSDSGGSAELPLNFEQSSSPHLSDGLCFSCISHSDSESAAHPMSSGTDYTTDPTGPVHDDVPEPWTLPFRTDVFEGINGSNTLQSLLEEIGISITHTQTDTLQTPTAPDNFITGTTHCQGTQSDRRIKYDNKQQICDITVIGEDGQPRPCGKVSKNTNALSSHKSKYHTGRKTCHMALIGQDGRQWRCGRVCKNAQALTLHKRREHSGQQTCRLTVVGEDGQPRPCGTICKNAVAMAAHKNKCHTGQQICNVITVGKDGQPQQCGKVCSNAKTLSGHKNRKHSEQKTCVATLITKDGQQRPCGKVCSNVQALSVHKRRYHTGPKSCDVTVFGQDDQPQPCGTFCKNLQALKDHKRRHHSKQQICNITVIGKDGQQRRCGKVCNNAIAFTDHKRIHRKRTSADEHPEYDSNLKKSEYK
ncbi:hypothetical protein [Endozoicomonas sp. SESOKO4]|uniref:hypothetical protein n=1 Tax=Endozoicomonas sp. SESOKO4 TaxID=2828745 RepID=UPI0021480199|nr:hypothetical protein [Endozoicomonas sp. SESOKO4]